MATSRFPVLVHPPEVGPLHGSLVSLREVARLADMHPALVERLIALGLVEPAATTPEPLFDVATVLRLRRIVRLRRDLGINWVGIGVVLDLLAKIEVLEQEIARLRRSKG